MKILTRANISLYNNLIKDLEYKFDNMFYLYASRSRVNLFQKNLKIKVKPIEQIRQHFFIIVETIRLFIIYWIINKNILNHYKIENFNHELETKEAFSQLEDFTNEVKKLNIFDL